MMKPFRKKLALLSAATFLALSGVQAHADEAASDPAAGLLPASGANAMYIPYGGLQNSNKAAIEHAAQVGQDVARDLLAAYDKRKDDPDLAASMQQIKERVDQISDPVNAANRDKVLDFLGIDPQSRNGLYYFVSWSMPLEMLRSYAIEAMWDGGTLVFKGIPPGRTFAQFLRDDMSQLAYGKGAAAAVELDPRLFDAYQVDTVPTIVLTTDRTNMTCIGVPPTTFQYKGQQLSYDMCPPLDPSKYVKMSGAVTSNYALQAFIDDGWTQAKPYLKALAKGYATGQTPGKEQQPFAGEWKAVVSPSDRMAAQAGANAAFTAGYGASATPAAMSPAPAQ